ncbi:hypothetical protein ACWC5C_41545 [Streptomyces sp. NPDC001700]
MRRTVRTTAVAAALGAVTLFAAPMAQAAPSAAAATAEPGCITGSEEQAWGRGEIKLCVQSNGKTRVTGYVEDLKPGGGWGAPDGYCVSWYLGWTLPNGNPGGEFGPIVCPHFTPSHQAKKEFDYEYQPSTPVQTVKLSLASA